MRGTLRWIRADPRAHRRLLSPGGTTPSTPRCPGGSSPMAKTAIVPGPPRPDGGQVYRL
jgi:hypothetical protein